MCICMDFELHRIVLLKQVMLNKKGVSIGAIRGRDKIHLIEAEQRMISPRTVDQEIDPRSLAKHKARLIGHTATHNK